MMLQRLLALTGAWTAAALVAGCATAPPVLAPNANLVAQGIPPVPAEVAERIARYTDFRGHTFLDWHPTRNAMLVAHRTSGTPVAQVHLLDSPMGTLQPLTEGNEPATNATFEPREGRYIVFERSSGGNEAARLYRMDIATRRTEPITDADHKHEIVGWVRATSMLLYTAVPLDRTAAGGSRASIETGLWMVDPQKPDARRKVADLPGGGWFGGDVASDGRRLAMTRYVSASESEVWIVDLADGSRRQVLPAPGAPKAAHFGLEFLPDGRRLLVLTDRAGEFRELIVADVGSGEAARLTAQIPWDVSMATVSGDGRHIVAQVNVDGRDELRSFDAATLRETAAIALPKGSGSMSQAMRFARGGARLAFSVDSASTPNQVFVADAATGRVEPWTRAEAPPGVDTSSFPPQEIVRWKSFDGRTISGLLARPPARFAGKRPVIVSIHGGPEGQATMRFLGRWGYFVQELGVALIEPNVRGSAGYGKTFLTLDDGMKREDSVKDIGTLLDWIATQPDLDASRVMITGGSYGGYMTLASAVHYSPRIVGGMAAVAPSNFVTFLTNTESYRRDLRRVEYGDERDPAMRAFLERIAPLNNTDKITQPLFVIQGRNDPRVPYTESEQMVAKLRERGQKVWYLRAENEGHGFVRKENVDFMFAAMVLFCQERLRLR